MNKKFQLFNQQHLLNICLKQPCILEGKDRSVISEAADIEQIYLDIVLHCVAIIVLYHLFFSLIYEVFTKITSFLKLR